MNRLADPIVEFLELVIRVRRIEPAQQKQRDRELCKRSRKCDPADPHVIVRAEQKQSCNAQERQKSDDRQQVRT